MPDLPKRMLRILIHFEKRHKFDDVLQISTKKTAVKRFKSDFAYVQLGGTVNRIGDPP